MKRIIIGVLAAICLAACTNYGKKVSKDNVEVYYKDGITKEQAEKTLDFLLQVKKESDSKTKDEKKSFQLSKGNGDTINFRMVADKDKVVSIGDEAFANMANLVSSNALNNAPVNILFTNNKFKEYRALAFKSVQVPDYGEKVKSGNAEVYYEDGLSEKTAQDLAAFLDKEMSPATTYSFRLTKNAEGTLVLSMVSDEENVKSVTDESLRDMAKKISHTVLSGTKLVFQMTDDAFKPLKSYEYGGARPGELYDGE